jgi:hypothetical protein
MEGFEISATTNIANLKITPLQINSFLPHVRRVRGFSLSKVTERSVVAIKQYKKQI